eukprot:g6845.t1
MAGSAFYAVFGRLQYNTNATQEVCAILYGAMAQNAAVTLRKVGRADQIQPTILALIVSSTMLTGICSVLLGKLGVGKLMLRFPTPVTSGFLGTIGFFLVRTALQVSSGVQFVNFYPVDFGDRLLEKYLYQSSLKGYMLEYRNACSTGARLANEAFEAMNLLPEGFLTQIQPFCAIQMGLASGQRLAEDDAFCFVFQGAIAVVNELSDQKQTSQGVSIKGFQGRRQKRLRKRYPILSQNG